MEGRWGPQWVRNREGGHRERLPWRIVGKGWTTGVKRRVLE